DVRDVERVARAVEVAHRRLRGERVAGPEGVDLEVGELPAAEALVLSERAREVSRAARGVIAKGDGDLLVLPVGRAGDVPEAVGERDLDRAELTRDVRVRRRVLRLVLEDELARVPREDVEVAARRRIEDGARRRLERVREARSVDVDVERGD